MERITTRSRSACKHTVTNASNASTIERENEAKRLTRSEKRIAANRDSETFCKAKENKVDPTITCRPASKNQKRCTSPLNTITNYFVSERSATRSKNSTASEKVANVTAKSDTNAEKSRPKRNARAKKLYVESPDTQTDLANENLRQCFVRLEQYCDVPATKDCKVDCGENLEHFGDVKSPSRGSVYKHAQKRRLRNTAVSLENLDDKENEELGEDGIEENLILDNKMSTPCKASQNSQLLGKDGTALPSAFRKDRIVEYKTSTPCNSSQNVVQRSSNLQRATVALAFPDDVDDIPVPDMRNVLRDVSPVREYDFFVPSVNQTVTDSQCPEEVDFNLQAKVQKTYSRKYRLDRKNKDQCTSLRRTRSTVSKEKAKKVGFLKLPYIDVAATTPEKVCSEDKTVSNASNVNPKKKKTAKSSKEFEKWAEEINKCFEELDSYELCVE